MSNRPPRPRVGGLLNVGRFRGVPIYFAPSWLLIATFLTVYYGPIVSDAVPDVSSSTAYLAGFAFAVSFALCVLAHELGHTAASIALGNPVRRVVIFFLGGVSEIEREPKRPREEFLVAVAGPAVSLGIGGGGALIYEALPRHSLLGVLVGLLTWSNLVVAGFNLVPGLPLDGGRALRAGVWAVGRSRLVATRIAAWAGRLLAVAVAGSALLVDRSPWGLGAGVVSLALGAYLWFGAGQAVRAAVLASRLPALDLRRLLRPGLMVPAEVSVADALRRAQHGRARGILLVDAAQRPLALVDEARIASVPLDSRAWTPVRSVARTLTAGLVIGSDASGEDVLAAVRRTPASEYLVIDRRGQPAGILAFADLAAYLEHS